MAADFHGLPAATLDNGHIRLDYLTGAGPRIVRLVPAGSDENLLAEVPDIVVPSAYGEYRLHGGHRLWHAPEAFPRTYLPDDAGLRVEATPVGVRLIMAEAVTGIVKTVEVRLEANRAAAILTHRLENGGLWPVDLAPWAITQLRLGGLLALPQTSGPVDAAGLLPNRQLALWPYTRLADPRLILGDDLVLVNAQPQVPALKIGWMNRRGWLAYHVAGFLFVKRIVPQPDRLHVDFGCNAEVYCNDRFIEAETLGPLASLAPGAEVSHVEEWEVHKAGDVPQTPAGMAALVQRFGLD